MKLSHTSVSLLICLTLSALFGAAQVRQRQPRRESPARPTTQPVTELATAVNELLKEEPLVVTPATKTAKTVKVTDQPPADDAPLEELIAYWQQPHYREDDPKPSAAVSQRLLEAIEARPWLFNQLSLNLPSNEETAERLYRVYQQMPDEEDRWKSALHHWLMYNSRYFLDELLQEAQARVGLKSSGIDSPGEFFGVNFALDALARLDWERAKPLLLARPQNGFTLSSLYRNAVSANDSVLVESVRQQLQTLVADPQNGEMRSPALAALLETDWEGQAAWFASLFADSSLTRIQPSSSAASPPVIDTLGISRSASYLAIPLARHAKRLVPNVCQLVGDANRAIHNAAVDTLTHFVLSTSVNNEQTAAAVQALLPWLSDPAWADVPQREMLIGALSKLNLPESAPGMLWVMSNDEDDTLRALAAETLGNLKYQPAAPVIRVALEREKDEALRPRLIAALMRCGGITDDEAAAALEAFARRLVTPAGAAQIKAIRESQDAEPLPLPISIGRILSDDDTLPCPPGLAARLFERVRALRRTQPDVAKEILNIVQGVQLPLAYQFLAQRIGEGWVDVAALKLALESAADMRQHASSDLYPLLERGGYAAGVAAALLADEIQRNAVLQGKDVQAQLALLAAARYQRTSLPLDLVAALFREKTLAAAAENYLIIEDSAAARRLVWARHPGEALILGEQQPRGDVGPYNPEKLPALEKSAQQVVKGEVEELIALYNDGEQPKVEIRVSQGRAQIRLFTDPQVWRARLLTDSELIEVQTLLARPEVQELKPEVPVGGYQEHFAEFLHLRKQGGYRIVLEGMRPAPRNATLHEQIADVFYRLSQTGGYETHYALEAKLPGVEVLYADDKHPLLTVCQENRETLVLVADAIAKGPATALPAPQWRLFQQNQLGANATPPTLFREVNELMESNAAGFLVALSLFRGQHIGLPSQLRSLAKAFDRGSVAASGEVSVSPENYSMALTTPDGKWVIGCRQDEARGPLKLLRYNTETKQEFTVRTERQQMFFPVSFLDAQGKVLVSSGAGNVAAGSGTAYFLLDPASGAFQAVQGEFRPLQDQVLRPLQPTGKANEFWTTLYEPSRKRSRLGRYNAQTFTFAPVLDVAELELHSSDVWVDEPLGKVWLVYRGHLLRLPLPTLAR